MKICGNCGEPLENHAEVGGKILHKFDLDSDFDMETLGAILYAKFGHLSKQQREEKGIWFGDGKQ
jgi:hypothetical protein